MASNIISCLHKEIQLCSHHWALEAWPGHFSGQNTWPLHKNFGPKSELASNGLQHNSLFSQRNPVALSPLTSDHWPKFLWSGQVIWPEKCPGPASRAQWCERNWISLWRQTICPCTVVDCSLWKFVKSLFLAWDNKVWSCLRFWYFCPIFWPSPCHFFEHTPYVHVQYLILAFESLWKACFWLEILQFKVASDFGTFAPFFDPLHVTF